MTERSLPWRRLSLALPGQGGFYEEAAVSTGGRAGTQLTPYGGATLTPVSVTLPPLNGVARTVSGYALGDAEVVALRVTPAESEAGVTGYTIETSPAP